MASTYKGKCHCGNVEFEANVKKEHVLCHCNTCKQLSGGSYTLNQIIPETDLRITKNSNKDPKLGMYQYDGVSGNPVLCYYCTNCATHIYHDQTVNKGNIVLRTGLIDGNKAFQPQVEIFTKDNYSWEPETFTCFKEMPQ